MFAITGINSSDFSSLRREVDFERTRIKNLIDCRLARGEMEIVRELEEKLRNIELSFSVKSFFQKIAFWGRVTVKAVLLFVSMAAISILLAVFDIYPYANMAATVFLVLAIVATVFLMGAIGRRMYKKMDEMLAERKTE